MNFFRSFFASLLALLVGLLILVPVLILVIGGLIATLGGDGDTVTVQPQTVLHLTLSEPIYEQAPDAPIGLDLGKLLPIGGSSSRVTGLYQLLADLDQAQSDPQVEGIYLDLGPTVPTGWASLHDIHAALVAFRATGKFVYAYGPVWGEKSYFLATAADSIFMPAEGLLEFNGFSSTPLFWKGLLDKLDLKPEVFRVGTFKSAVEPFLRQDMSAESKAQTALYLDGLWDDFADLVALRRNHSRSHLDTLANRYILLRGRQAAAEGLIDGLRTESAVYSRLALASGRQAEDAPNLLSMRRYGQRRVRPAYSRNRITVIFAAGTLMAGESTLETAGAETLLAELRRARKDERVKAVVLRINSPGGDALAAELIAEEIEATQAVKPVIASMGDYAASGGYYLAAPCQYIFAHPTTLTGSIGVFGIYWDAQAALDQQLGLRFDRVETHPQASLGNPGFALRPAERAFFQQNVEHTYGLFIRRVQQGRNFTDSLAVDAVAQGRVWTGRAAKDRQLVDAFGNLQDAIDYAARAAGLGEDMQIDRRPRLKSPLETIMDQMTESRLAAHPLGQSLARIATLQQYLPGTGVYALELELLGEFE